MQSENNLTRRNVLRVAGSSVVGVGAAGLASATDDRATVNVGYETGAGRRASLDAAGEVVREFEFGALTIRAPMEAVAGLANHPGVRYVEKNGTMHALGQTLSTGVDCIDADLAHACEVTGSGVDVAIVDTGIDSDHPDLQANLGAGRAFVNCNSSYGTCHYAWDDDHDHGTHVAGIVDAVDNSQGVVGVAPDATLHGVKVLEHDGTGTYSDIAAGIEWAANQGHEVINLSLGGPASQTVHNAVQYADSQGSILVGAAGDNGPCSNCVGYPAAYSEVIAVAATDECGTLANYTSTGPQVEFLAPGTNVYSTVRGGYDTFSGTSMAAPHVSGSVALTIAAGYANPVQRLCNTANNGSLCSCCGVVDPGEAVSC